MTIWRLMNRYKCPRSLVNKKTAKRLRYLQTRVATEPEKLLCDKQDCMPCVYLRRELEREKKPKVAY